MLGRVSTIVGLCPASSSRTAGDCGSGQPSTTVGVTVAKAAMAVAMRWWKNGSQYATVSRGRNLKTGQRSASTSASEWIDSAECSTSFGIPVIPDV